MTQAIFMSKAVVLLNMGAARSAGELRQFLFNMFLDTRIIASPIRYFLAPFIAQTRYKKVWQKYEWIGGSRLYQITENLADKLQDQLETDVIYAMRYTKPNLQEVIQGYDDLILLPLYPQYSTTTVQSSLDVLKKIKFKGQISIVKPFYDSESFNRLIAEKIKNEIANLQDKHLIFTAHGLPQKIVDQGDPYPHQIEAQVSLLKNILPSFKSVSLAYQSRFGNQPWLQPYLDDILPQFKNKNVVIYPLSFMIDNSETDLELQIEYAEKAKRYGINQYEVVACPNDAPQTLDFLVNLLKTYGA